MTTITPIISLPIYNIYSLSAVKLSRCVRLVSGNPSVVKPNSRFSAHRSNYVNVRNFKKNITLLILNKSFPKTVLLPIPEKISNQIPYTQKADYHFHIIFQIRQIPNTPPNSLLVSF